MNTVVTRLFTPTWHLVGWVVLLALLAVLALALWAGAVNDTEQFVGPFRWLPDEPMA